MTNDTVMAILMELFTLEKTSTNLPEPWIPQEGETVCRFCKETQVLNEETRELLDSGYSHIRSCLLKYSTATAKAEWDDMMSRETSPCTWKAIRGSKPGVCNKEFDTGLKQQLRKRDHIKAIIETRRKATEFICRFDECAESGTKLERRRISTEPCPRRP